MNQLPPKLSYWARATLRFLPQYHAQHSFMPTTREIAQACGFASQTHAVNALSELHKAGLIWRMPGPSGARAIRIVQQ